MEALRTRLDALSSAQVPCPCRVYAGLGAPGPLSARHAEATYARAQHLADGTVDRLPHFNTNPPSILRIVCAASWGRIDALAGPMDSLPDDLASDLWRRVTGRLADPETLDLAERRQASTLLLRLGYPSAAARIIGLADIDPRTHRFDPATAVEELMVLLRTTPDRELLEQHALEVARNRAFDARTRTVMATFVVVGNGRRGTDTPALRAAADLALEAMHEVDLKAFARHLLHQTVHRAVAYLPFLRGDRTGTLEALHRGLEEQTRAHAEISSPLDELSWIDHAFPLHETFARTHLAFEDPEAAIRATDELIELSPNDHRAWDARTSAFLAAGRPDQARDALARIDPLGGLAVGKAHFLRGWFHEQAGEYDDARASYRRSTRIDPTVPALRDALSRLGA